MSSRSLGRTICALSQATFNYECHLPSACLVAKKHLKALSLLALLLVNEGTSDVAAVSLGMAKGDRITIPHPTLKIVAVHLVGQPTPSTFRQL